MWSAVMGLSLVPGVWQYVQGGLSSSKTLRFALYSLS